MATKFKANAGTLPNASGLGQIPAGANRIPQGFLNGIGRKIDQGTVRFSGDFLFQQLPGGTVLQNIDDAGTSPFGSSTHPFKVTVVGKENGKIQVRISEGRLIGRTEYGVGSFADTFNGLADPNESLGIPGVDYSYNGGWPDGNPAPSTAGSQNPTNSGTQTTGGDKGSGNTFYWGPDKVAGNAGSIINPNSNGVFHTPTQSGNSGSITNPGQGNSGIYHTGVTSGAAGNINTYPQIYDKNYIQVQNGGGTFVQNPK